MTNNIVRAENRDKYRNFLTVYGNRQQQENLSNASRAMLCRQQCCTQLSCEPTNQKKERKGANMGREKPDPHRVFHKLCFQCSIQRVLVTQTLWNIAEHTAQGMPTPHTTARCCRTHCRRGYIQNDLCAIAHHCDAASACTF